FPSLRRLMLSSDGCDDWMRYSHYQLGCCLFFFSSRRRHTRCYRDWSSDVCSSDLTPIPALPLLPPRLFRALPTPPSPAPSSASWAVPTTSPPPSLPPRAALPPPASPTTTTATPPSTSSIPPPRTLPPSPPSAAALTPL